MPKLWIYSVRSLWQRRTTSLASVLGIAMVIATFLLESVVLSLAGALGGVGLALLTPLLDFSTVNFATAQDVAFRFTPSFEILLVALALGGVLGVLAGVLPALGAARMSPTEAMRSG